MKFSERVFRLRVFKQSLYNTSKDFVQENTNRKFKLLKDLFLTDVTILLYQMMSMCLIVGSLMSPGQSLSCIKVIKTRAQLFLSDLPPIRLVPYK